MTVISRNQAYVNKANRTLTQMEKLIEALQPNPQEWIYSGECNDLGAPTGECVCGHEIRFEFVVERKGERKILGSVCIENYAQVSPAMAEWMREDLKRMMDKIRADKKAAEMLAAQEKIQAVRQKYLDAIAEMNCLVDEHIAAKPNSRYPLPYELWQVTSGSKAFRTHSPEYVTPAPYVKWYEKMTAKVYGVIQRNKLAPLKSLIGEKNSNA